MTKVFTKQLASFLLIIAATISVAFSQTITIGAVDPGQYGPGSTIAIPFHVNDNSACISQSNVFSLIISDANGNFTSTAAVDTIQNFYGTFFNYTVPNNLPAGTGYRFMITSSSPAVSSAASGAVTINTLPGPTASVTTQSISNQANTASAFGTCSGNNGITYTISNLSTAGAIVTGSFFNELTQTTEASNVSINPNYNFTANAANYTMIIKSFNGAVVSTYAYQLINNVINSNIGITGNPSVCITPGNNGGSAITYNIDYQSPAGIQYNYPGNVYEFNWGDGSAISVYTLCQIVAAGGKISHVFTKPSCGSTSNNQINSFEIDFKIKNIYCDQVGSTSTSYAKVIEQPFNDFTGTLVSCTGSSITFTNTSNPGPDPNATTSSCNSNPNALYTWLVDGVIQASGYKLLTPFVYNFTTPGNHAVTLRLQNGNGPCIPTDSTHVVCIQNPPQPNFTVPTGNLYCLPTPPATGGVIVSPTNTSVVDANCNTSNQYIWTVTDANKKTVTPQYANGTNANSFEPQFIFDNIGIYTISLSITTASCGTVSAPQTYTVVVNATPVAKLSADYAVCGTGVVVFDNTTGSPSYTQLTGTAQPQPTTYTWTVTGGNFAYADGTTANSQYPHINFQEAKIYMVTVNQTNNCGSTTSTAQQITVQEAPTVTAGSNGVLCQGNAYQLNGQITGKYNNAAWVGGNGTFSPNRTTLNATYTPSSDEISAGTVTLTLQATTNLAAPCNLIQSPVTITIVPTNVVTSGNAVTICSGQSVGYTITDQNASNTDTWTAVLTSGNATGFANGSGNAINDVITLADPTATAVVTYTITPVTNNCSGTPFTLTVTIPGAPILTATVANATICSNQPTGINVSSNQTTALYTWTSTASNASIAGNTSQTTPISITGINDILTNSSAVAASVTYVITPVNYNGCAGASQTITINVQPLPIAANAGPAATLCNASTYTLQGNNPSPGQGTWTLVSGPPVTFADNTQYNTTVSGLIGGNIYQFQWTISTAPGCQSISTVIITNNAQTVGGTTATTDPTTVCAGSNSGQINLTGQIGSVSYWQQSVDNGITWQTLVNTANSQTFLNLTQTTQYRAVVQSGVCDAMVSSVTTITVNQPVVQSVAGPDQSLCNVTSTTLNGNNPGVSAGVWQQISGPAVVIADPNNYQTAVTGLQPGNVYSFTWTIIAQPPCANSQSLITITDNADVVASFTQSANGGCGNTTFQFTNTSTNQQYGSFVWDFGDGASQSTLLNPSHLFRQRTDGRDTTYYITLSVVGNCVQRAPIVDSVTISPAVPIARILPNRTNACGTFTLKVQNESPGNNASYVFYLYQGSTLVQQITKTDKSTAVFDPITTQVVTEYSLFMVATGFCGTSDETVHIPITISPPTFVAQTFTLNNLVSGCAPFTTTFVNNSSGGSTFYYSIYDANNKLVAQPLADTANFTYTFNTAGSYTVTLTASNDCGTVVSVPVSITVYPVPVPDFTSSFNTGCRNVTIQFTNLTADNGSTPAQSLSYDWDFGDGSPHGSGFTPAPHTYNYANSPYSVTLTVVNLQSGCSSFTTKTNYIVVNPPPFTAFTEKPDSVTTIPNYHFSFLDQTPGYPVAWNWQFSDGQTSTRQNPEITFADTGFYKVTLTTVNKFGCDSTISHTVRVTGVPGQLYVPNAFIPSSGTAELKVFMAKGSGIKDWHMQIFNNYGQLVWETTRLDAKGAPVDGWDGTFQGAPAPQGVYVWQISAKFINGTEWKGMSYNNSLPKRIGSVNLIR